MMQNRHQRPVLLSIELIILLLSRLLVWLLSF